MSDSDDDGLCDEISRRRGRGMKEEKMNLFAFERSFIRDEDGLPCWGRAPDDAQALSFALFLSDPAKLIQGSASDSALRPRLNILESEVLFYTVVGDIRHDAREHVRVYQGADGAAGEDLQAELTEPLVLEVLCELTAMYLFYTAAQKSKQQKRSISDTVGLLRETRSSILAMTTLELTSYRGRSLVSLLIEFSEGPIREKTTREENERHNEERRRALQAQQHQQNTQNQQKQNLLNQQNQQKKTPTVGKQKFQLIPASANLTCTTCQGMGHLAGKCVPVNPSTSAMTCYLCRGKGHGTNICPSDKEPVP